MQHQAIDLKEIYELRHNYTIVGLTGLTGSGCSEVAEILASPMEKINFPPPKTDFEHNNDRKYRIVHEFGTKNWRQFEVLKYKEVISLFILEYGLNFLTEFLDNLNSDKDYIKSGLSADFSSEVTALKQLSDRFESLHKRINEINPQKGDSESLKQFLHLFNGNDFKSLSNDLHDSLAIVSPSKRIKALQIICNNLRYGGCYFCLGNESMVNVYVIAEKINLIIKAFRETNRNINTEVIKPTCVVIDSLRNPFEIMYFKERYSAFYMFAVHSDESLRCDRLKVQYGNPECDKIKELDKEEYQAERGEFYKQDVSNCLQKADVHLNFIETIADPQKVEGIEEANYLKGLFNIRQQILLYLSLIYQPGIVTPSPQERCMQIAYTAKYNSGCISRQVGAVVTDANYSIKSVGWNNTAEGQVPCVLRNASDLVNGRDKGAFTEYEKTDPKFQKAFLRHFKDPETKNMNGHNCSFCFKTIQNSITEGKNQVHTRSLHAEENAFLQIAKYGGQSVSGGKLFSTASPCELCAKKAYQLGIRAIYFIDQYPGISQTQILKGGSERTNPKVRQFQGAIAGAYHKLYEPFMAYKDELNLRMGIEIQDVTKTQKSKIAELERQIQMRDYILNENGIEIKE